MFWLHTRGVGILNSGARQAEICVMLSYINVSLVFLSRRPGSRTLDENIEQNRPRGLMQCTYMGDSVPLPKDKLDLKNPIMA